MRTVAELTEQFIIESPFLEESLALGIINLSSLARRLMPRIYEKNLKKTSQGAVVMALQRLGKKLKKQQFGKSQTLNPRDLTLRSDIAEYVFALTPNFIKLQKQLFEHLGAQKEIYLTTAQGVSEATIFISASVTEEVEKLFNKEKLLFYLGKQSVIILRFAQNTIRIPGVYYNILKALAWEGVPINEVVSVGNELSLVFESKHIDKAFSILQKLIKS